MGSFTPRRAHRARQKRLTKRGSRSLTITAGRPWRRIQLCQSSHAVCSAEMASIGDGQVRGVPSSLSRWQADLEVEMHGVQRLVGNRHLLQQTGSGLLARFVPLAGLAGGNVLSGVAVHAAPVQPLLEAGNCLILALVAGGGRVVALRQEGGAERLVVGDDEAVAVVQQAGFGAEVRRRRCEHGDVLGVGGGGLPNVSDKLGGDGGGGAELVETVSVEVVQVTSG
jgi:hypothetical protein